MKPYIVFLNGPPDSGKDYAADTLMHDSGLHVETYKFAYPLKRIAAMLLGTSLSWVEQNKATVVQPYNVTVRQLLIDISEKWMKPCYGNDIFGVLCRDMMASAIQNFDENSSNIPGDGSVGIGQPDIFVVSDSGFDKEAYSVLRLFGNDNALLIRLQRDGRSFMGDSRSYIELDGVRSVDIHNDGTRAFGNKIVDTVKSWIKEKNNG